MSGIVAFYIPDWLGRFQESIRLSRESRMMRGGEQCQVRHITYRALLLPSPYCDVPPPYPRTVMCLYAEWRAEAGRSHMHGALDVQSVQRMTPNTESFMMYKGTGCSGSFVVMPLLCKGWGTSKYMYSTNLHRQSVLSGTSTVHI